MSKPRLEAAIAKDIVRYLNSLDGCRARRHTASGPYNQAGEPDIDACLNGRAIKIEVKRQRPRRAHLDPRVAEEFMSCGATALQAQTLVEWGKSGAVVGVAYEVDDVKALLQREQLI